MGKGMRGICESMCVYMVGQWAELISDGKKPIKTVSQAPAGRSCSILSDQCIKICF